MKSKKKGEKIRIKLSRADRRSGAAKQEGKVSKAKSKRKSVRSQKKTATIKKSRY